MRKWYLGFLLLLSVSANIYANPANEEIKIRITDENQKPIFGVYFILKKQFTLLATSDMEGEGTFPGQFFTTFRYHCIPRHRICNGPIQFTGTEKASGLHYAGAAIQPTGGDSHGHISERNLKESHRKITKNKSRTFTRLPLLTDRHNMKRSPSAGIRQSNTGENSVFTSLQAT